MKRTLTSILALTTMGAHAQEAKTVRHSDVEYRVVEAKPSQIRILWKDGEGKQLKQIPTAADYLKAKGEEPVMVVNGGIFEPGHVPSGLLIQEGKELNAVNRRDGKGNFFLKPNGIFLIREGKAEIVDTADYKSSKGVTYAVQSGPLLLMNGKTHPVFKAGSSSRLHRNGIGVRKDGTVMLAITDLRQEKHPNLFEFADFFRSLGCENALFLDGDLSLMRSGGDMKKRGNPFASMIAVVAGQAIHAVEP